MTVTLPGLVALAGSGEFLPIMRPVDELLLDGRARRVAVLPTAAGREGAGRIRYWLDLANRHYRALDTEVVEIPVLARDHAFEPRWVDALAGVGLVYLSGGDPFHLVATLRDSPVWAAIQAGWRDDGVPIAGCSAGAMALAEAVVPLRRGGDALPALDVVPSVAVLPHFDRWTDAGTMLTEHAAGTLPNGLQLVGVDEDTVLVGRPGEEWTVAGRGRVHLLGQGAATESAGAGERVRLTSSGN